MKSEVQREQICVLWRQKHGVDVLLYNVGLEDLEEPMCLSSPSSYNGHQLCWDLCEIQHFSQQQIFIALGEDPETQRGDDTHFPSEFFPQLLVILKAVMLKTSPHCNLPVQFPITSTG